MYSIVIADDHEIFSSALSNMVDGFFGCQVLYEVANGRELLSAFKDPKRIPDLVLLDINMPIMDGFQTMKELHKRHPEIHVLCLSMNDDRRSFLTMIDNGAHGFISKMAKPKDLEQAIESVMRRGCYYTSAMADMLFRSMSHTNELKEVSLNRREKELLTYVATEMTYQEIAVIMCLSPKTVDGYRYSLFKKLDIKSRVGLAMYAVKNEYYTLQ